MSTQGQPRLGRAPLVLVVPAALAALLLIVPLVTLVADTPWSRLGDQLTSSAVGDALRLTVLASLVTVVVCLLLGNVSERRHVARPLAHELLAQADKLMYEAKGEHASHVYPLRVRVENGALVELGPDEYVD